MTNGVHSGSIGAPLDALDASDHHARTIEDPWSFAAYCRHVKQSAKTRLAWRQLPPGRFRLSVVELMPRLVMICFGTMFRMCQQQQPGRPPSGVRSGVASLTKRDPS